MKREQAWPYVGYFVDSALAERNPNEAPTKALPKDEFIRLIGWQCGFEPMFVAVWSMFDDVKLNDDEAVEIATDLLVEKNWFADGPTEPNYIL